MGLGVRWLFSGEGGRRHGRRRLGRRGDEGSPPSRASAGVAAPPSRASAVTTPPSRASAAIPKSRTLRQLSPGGLHEPTEGENPCVCESPRRREAAPATKACVKTHEESSSVCICSLCCILYITSIFDHAPQSDRLTHTHADGHGHTAVRRLYAARVKSYGITRPRSNAMLAANSCALLASHSKAGTAIASAAAQHRRRRRKSQ